MTSYVKTFIENDHLGDWSPETSSQVVETLVASNSRSQDSNRPDDHFQSRYVTPGFKPFSQVKNATSSVNCVVCDMFM